jgi:hypothetical protein
MLNANLIRFLTAGHLSDPDERDRWKGTGHTILHYSLKKSKRGEMGFKI